MSGRAIPGKPLGWRGGGRGTRAATAERGHPAPLRTTQYRALGLTQGSRHSMRDACSVGTGVTEGGKTGQGIVAGGRQQRERPGRCHPPFNRTPAPS